MRLLVCLCLVSSLHAADLAFPKLDEARRVRGELVAADFIHRSGQFRSEKGVLSDFSMAPFAIMRFHGAEADMREVPLGTQMDFLMLPNGKLLTTDDGMKPDPEQQRKFREFTEKRGVAGWVTKTEAKQVTVRLFSGYPAFYASTYGELLAKGKTTKTCVANDELRTWNPGVDGEKGSIHEVRKIPADGFGFSGYQITVSVSNMLEGFRKGRVVRIFLQGWKVQDQFYGESLMGYGFGRMLNSELVENVAKEYPEQFPFRTDYGNEHLLWYFLSEDARPPAFSEHVVFGELVEADPKTGAGVFLTEKTAEKVRFTLVKKHSIKHLGKDTQFARLPLNQRYRFHCYQDLNAAFTRIAFISDDFSHMEANALRYRITRVEPGALHVTWELPEVKDYNGDMQQPPSIGASILRVSSETRLGHGIEGKTVADLKPGDWIRVNRTAELPGKPGTCVEIWPGEPPKAGVK